MRRRGFLKALAALPAVGTVAAVVKPEKVEPEPKVNGNVVTYGVTAMAHTTAIISPDEMRWLVTGVRGNPGPVRLTYLELNGKMLVGERNDEQAGV